MLKIWALILIMVASKEINLHPFQGKAFLSNKRIVVLCSGIQGGKTLIGGLWTRRKVSQFNEEGDNFIVTAPTYKIFKQATEPRFLEYFNGLGTYNKTDSIFSLSNNRKIYLRTLHDPNALEGITNVRAIWSDELGMYSYKAWVNIEGRSAVKQAQIFGTTTPYALNWLYRDVYKPWRDGQRGDIDFIQFQSVDNPYFPQEEFNRQRALLDERVFAMKYCGEFRKMAGLVFMDFDDVLNMCDVHTAWQNKDLYYVSGGLDWGFTNPFAITVRAQHRYEPRDYQIAEYYVSGLDPNQKLTIAKQYWQKFGIEQWYADNEAPDMIQLFNKAGMPTMGAPKYSRSLTDNIARHLSIIKSREHKIFKGCCSHTIDEYETYHYPEDSGKDENSPENPVDSQNHLMTANMYVTQCTEHIREKQREHRKVELVSKTHLDRLLDGEFATEDKEDWYNG